MQEQYYALTLDDYSAPSFTSFSKPYFGTLKEISAFINSLKQDVKAEQEQKYLIDAFTRFCDGDKNVEYTVAYNKVKLLTPVMLIATYEYDLKEMEWEHINVWGFPYIMRFGSAKIKHYWFKNGNAYIRCVKAKMKNLEYKVPHNSWKPVECGLWGFPNTIIFEAPYIYNPLAVVEKEFNSIDDLKFDDENFEPGKNIELKEFCNDIFGDG